MQPRSSTGIATVTSDSFLPGTLVMLHSFCRHNQWFDGDIIVIHDGLSPQSIARLKDSFDRVVLRNPDPGLSNQIDRLVLALPDLRSRKTRFLSLETFSLCGYDKILFCDSDLLFRGDVQEVFRTDDALICCGDGPYCRGNMRNAVTFSEIRAADRKAGLEKTFNAGFMVLDGSILTTENHHAMLSMIDVERWRLIETAHTDQYIYNVFFADHVRLVGPTYNFMLLHKGDVYKKYELSPHDAKVLHFNGPAKPWLPAKIVNQALKDSELMEAVQYWNSAYSEYLDCVSPDKIK